ncbi:glycosyl transferase [Vibrio splendidus]|uniref:Glycosyl transferase n=1 Tax=Vibrio splendidus TaxID=29497 RepID=A0ABD5AGE1_VIBSP|nr:glycosyl transferase [Vibrio splendidus]MDP2492206.1 glycosyl transferase [Vibrio splendidus]PMO50573.1 glycosyl transferase [Vibrio splendidus]
MSRKNFGRLKSIFKIPDYILKLQNNAKRDSLKKTLEESVYFSKLSIVDKSNVSLGVSLTTYGERIFDVHLVIETIALQTIRPERIILWLDNQEFNDSNLPLPLLKQIDRGLEVRFCENLKSYKKLIPSLELYPEYDWVTIDDDYLYPCYMLEQLTFEAKRYPGHIIGHRAHKMNRNSQGLLMPYLNWDIETSCSSPKREIFLTSGGGTLFPSGCFDKTVLDHDTFMSICSHADDVWFKAMALLSQTPCKKVDDPRPFASRFVQLESGNVNALSDENVDGGLNDEQIKLVFDKYNLWNYLS